MESISFIADKIMLLLSSGYSKVYLIADHGFVLTGLMSESDKICVELDGISEKSERYLRTSERQSSLVGNFIEAKSIMVPII